MAVARALLGQDIWDVFHLSSHPSESTLVLLILAYAPFHGHRHSRELSSYHSHGIYQPIFKKFSTNRVVLSKKTRAYLDLHLVLNILHLPLNEREIWLRFPTWGLEEILELWMNLYLFWVPEDGRCTWDLQNLQSYGIMSKQKLACYCSS